MLVFFKGSACRPFVAAHDQSQDKHVSLIRWFLFWGGGAFETVVKTLQKAPDGFFKVLVGRFRPPHHPVDCAYGAIAKVYEGFKGFG